MIRSRRIWYLASGIVLAAVLWWSWTSAPIPELSPAEMKFKEGQRLLDEARRDSSVRCFREAAGLFLKDSLWERWADAMIGLAENYRNYGQYDTATHVLDSVQGVIVQKWGTENALYAMTVNRLALIQLNQARYDTALAMFRRSLAIRTRVLPPDHPDIAWSLQNMGAYYHATARYDTAIAYYRKAIPMLQKTVGPDHIDVAWMVSNLGAAFRQAGDYDSAAYYLNNALSIRLAKEKNPASIAYTYRVLASLFHELGDYDEALRLHKQALTLFTQCLVPTHMERGSAYYNIGNQYASMDKDSQAIAAFNMALQIYRANDARDNIAQVYDKIGEIYSRRSKHAQAIESYRLAQEQRSVRKKNPYFFGRSYELIGLSQSHLGEHDSADWNIRKGIQIYESYYGRRHPAVGQGLINLSEAYLRAERLELADQTVEKAISALHRTFTPSRRDEFPDVSGTINRMKMCYALALKGDIVLMRSGHRPGEAYHELAGNCYEQAMNMADEVRLSTRSRLSKEFFGASTYRIYQKAFLVYYSLYKSTGNVEFADRAFRAVERARTFQLRQAAFHSKLESLTELPDSLRVEERSLRLQKEQIESRILNEQLGVTADSSKLVYLENARASAQQKYDDLTRQLRQSYPRQFLWQGKDIPTIQSVQKTIPDSNQALVEYFEADSTWHVFVIMNDEWHLMELGKFPDLGDRVSRLHEAIQHGDMTGYAVQAYEICRFVVEPLLDIAKKRWIVVPDGVLFRLPFDALLTEKPIPATYPNYAALSYLAKSRVISYAPSCTVLMAGHRHEMEEALMLTMSPFSRR